METYPPRIQTDFMGAPIPGKVAYGPTGKIEYFQEYRNETISRMKVPPYDWGMGHIPYTPHPDTHISVKSLDKYLKLPPPEFSMLDPGRNQEVEDFYIASQMHRDQYKDYSGSLHPLNYFKNADYMYQCPSDPTSKYMKYPDFFVKYKQPLVLPLTLERSLKTPYLPDRALTGVYSPSSDNAYKR